MPRPNWGHCLLAAPLSVIFPFCLEIVQCTHRAFCPNAIQYRPLLVSVSSFSSHTQVDGYQFGLKLGKGPEIIWPSQTTPLLVFHLTNILWFTWVVMIEAGSLKTYPVRMVKVVSSSLHPITKLILVISTKETSATIFRQIICSCQKAIRMLILGPSWTHSPIWCWLKSPFLVSPFW